MGVGLGSKIELHFCFEFDSINGIRHLLLCGKIEVIPSNKKEKTKVIFEMDFNKYEKCKH